MFEGEYLNGERNGKGKEYNKDNLEFEGEYLNGERHGKGKEYYDNGRIKFEGEYIKGKKWNGIGYNPRNNKVFELKGGLGIVKEYDNKGNLIFEGEYLNGERWKGKGYEINSEGKLISKYEYLKGKIKY